MTRWIIPLVLAALATAAVAQGLVPDQVSRYYMPNRAVLADAPGETLVAEPAYQGTPKYAALPFGNGADSTITMVLDEVKEGDAVTGSHLYVDANNDNDLTNDGDGAWANQNEQTWSTSTELSLLYAGATEAVPYKISLYRFKTRLPEVILYYRNMVVETTAEIGGRQVKVVLVDDNTDGLFDDLAVPPVEGQASKGALFVDRNGDGKIQPGGDSAEIYRAGEPFEMDGKIWELTGASPDGTSLTFAESDKPCTPKLYLEKGYPAPDFELTDTQGATFKLSDYRGKVVLIDFWASWCGPCKAEMPNVIRDYQAFRDKGFEIIGISLDRARADMDTYLGANPDVSWRMVCSEMYWDDPTSNLYRVSGIPAAFLIDRDGNIYGQVRGDTLTKGLEALLGPAGEAATTGEVTSEPVTPEDAVGKLAPEIVAEGLDGKPFKLSDLRGKVVLLDFWATWCPPCRAEIPKIVELAGAYAGKDLVIVGLHFDREKDGVSADDQVRAFAEENGMTWRQVAGMPIAELYGIGGIPTQVVIDAEGKIVAYAVGSGQIDHEAVIGGLLGE